MALVCFRGQFIEEGLLTREHLYPEPLPRNEPCPVQRQWLAEGMPGEPSHQDSHTGPAGLQKVTQLPP